MKKLIIIFSFLLVTVDLLAPRRAVLYIMTGDIIAPYEKLWQAVCQVESNGDRMAYNKGEKAYGIVQVRSVRLKDFNRRTGKSYNLVDMYDTVKSKEVFMYYTSDRSYERVARSWNGSGKKTTVYWKKVKSNL